MNQWNQPNMNQNNAPYGAQGQFQQGMNQAPYGVYPAMQPQTQHSVPKCTCCGYEGPWKKEKIFRGMDWVIGLSLLLLFGTGLIYLIVVGLIRMNPNNRAKICPKCGARNLWTFLY